MHKHTTRVRCRHPLSCARSIHTSCPRRTSATPRRSVRRPPASSSWAWSGPSASRPSSVSPSGTRCSYWRRAGGNCSCWERPSSRCPSKRLPYWRQPVGSFFQTMPILWTVPVVFKSKIHIAFNCSFYTVFWRCVNINT